MQEFVELTQVPYGNAQGTGRNVQCQHGEQECQGNKYECCAIQIYPNATQWFPFVDCMENAGDNMLSEVKNCAMKASLDYSKIDSCFNGQAGIECINKAAAATNALNPPHQYTPWVTVNGRHLAGAQHLMTIVCNEIKKSGATPPSSCSSATDDDDHPWDDGNAKHEVAEIVNPCMNDGPHRH